MRRRTSTLRGIGRSGTIGGSTAALLSSAGQDDLHHLREDEMEIRFWTSCFVSSQRRRGPERWEAEWVAKTWVAIRRLHGRAFDKAPEEPREPPYWTEQSADIMRPRWRNPSFPCVLYILEWLNSQECVGSTFATERSLANSLGR